MGLSIKYVIGWTLAESGYTSLMCTPDGRVVRIVSKISKLLPPPLYSVRSDHS